MGMRSVKGGKHGNEVSTSEERGNVGMRPVNEWKAMEQLASQRLT